MIKKFFCFILLAGLILVIILSIKETVLNNPSNILKGLPKQEWSIFSVGKELVYLVKYMGIIPIGKAKIRVDGSTRYEGRDVYKLVAEAETSNFASIFYKAKARIESYMDMDKNKFYSLRYKEELFLPDKEVETKEIIYDQKNLIMTRGNFKRKILSNTQDPLSAIFYLRTQDFDITKSFSINIITKEENYGININVIKKSDGIFLLKSTIERQDKTRQVGTFYFWITDDLRRLPILIKGWTKAGLITARLIEIR